MLPSRKCARALFVRFPTIYAIVTVLVRNTMAAICTRIIIQVAGLTSSTCPMACNVGVFIIQAIGAGKVIAANSVKEKRLATNNYTQ